MDQTHRPPDVVQQCGRATPQTTRVTHGDAPFFIVGAGRSGTTLLRLMLSGHSRLHIPNETWFVRPLVERLPLTGGLSRPQVADAIAIMTGHERWPDMAFPAEVLRREALALTEPCLADVIDLVYHRFGAASGKPRIGDKTPHYFMILPQLATLYPQARFIHLIRDGRDVAMSWIDAGWNRYHERDFEWTRTMRLRPVYAASSLAPSICEIRYEALIAQSERSLRQICGFLREDFEPAMLDWRVRVDQVAERDRHLHGKLVRPLAAEAIAPWRHKLAAWECFAIESCLGRELQSLDYRLRFAARTWRPVLTLTGALLRLASPALRRGIPVLQRCRMLPRRPYL